MKDTEKHIMVGLSGGVDSSVSALLLKEKYTHVTGAFIRTWQPDFIECTWKQDRRDAIRIAAKIGIPFKDIEAEKAYKEKVAEYMISEYKAGRTPNPDILCNREIKFGVFWQQARDLGITHIATGHYAQNFFLYNEWQLHMSKDLEKDQTYFLWKLTQDDLAHTLFPVGHLVKKDVRVIAEKADLSTAAKKDSQGVCMLGDLDMKDFLKHYIDEVPGDVVDSTGTVVGKHDGVWFFTIGERHGFKIDGAYSEQGPWYVVKKDIENNTLVVRSSQEKIEEIKNTIQIDEVNWISKKMPELGTTIQFRTRYRETLKQGTILSIENKIWTIQSDDISETACSGQSLVMYTGTQCLGGGVII
jgi:tRNA-specific 2-thiouridylase